MVVFMSRISLTYLEFNEKVHDKIIADILASKYSDAVAFCDELSQSPANTENPQFLFDYAKALTKSRDFIKAKKIIDDAIIHNKSAEYFELKAHILMYLGHHLESLKAAETAIELNQDSIGGRIFEGRAKKFMHKDTEAREAFSKGVDAVGKFHGVREVESDSWKALLGRFTEEYDHGIRYSQYLIKEAPEFTSGYVDLGINLLLKFQAQDPKAKDDSLLAQAFENFNLALAKYPDPVAMYYKGKAFGIKGDNDNAIREYEESMRLSPGYVNPVIELAYIYMQSNPHKALELLNTLLEINPGSEEALLVKSKVFISMDILPEAEKCIDALLALNGTCTYFYYKKAIIQSAQAKYSEALETCGIALSLSTYDIDVLHQRAHIYTILEQYQDALKDADKIIQTQPQSPLGYQTKACVLSEMITNQGGGFEYFYNSHVPAVNRTEEISQKIRDSNIEEAEFWYYNKITEENKDCLISFSNACKLISDGGSSEEIISFLKESTGRNPSFISAFVTLSNQHEKDFMNIEAEDALFEANSINSEYVSSLTKNTKLPYTIFLEKEALMLHDKSISLNRDDPTLYISKAGSLAKFQEIDGIEECLQNASTLLGVGVPSPEDENIFRNLQSTIRNELISTARNLIRNAQELHNSIEDPTATSIIDVTMVDFGSETSCKSPHEYKRSGSFREMRYPDDVLHQRLESHIALKKMVSHAIPEGKSDDDSPCTQQPKLNFLYLGRSKLLPEPLQPNARAMSVGSGCIDEPPLVISQSKDSDITSHSGEQRKEELKDRSVEQLKKSADVFTKSIALANDNTATTSQINEMIGLLKQALAENNELKVRVTALEAETACKRQMDEDIAWIRSITEINDYYVTMVSMFSELITSAKAAQGGFVEEKAGTGLPGASILSSLPIPFIGVVVNIIDSIVSFVQETRISNQAIRVLRFEGSETLSEAETIFQKIAIASCKKKADLIQRVKTDETGFVFELMATLQEYKAIFFEGKYITAAQKLAFQDGTQLGVAFKAGKLEKLRGEQLIETCVDMITSTSIQQSFLQCVRKGYSLKDSGATGSHQHVLSCASTDILSPTSIPSSTQQDVWGESIRAATATAPTMKWYQKLLCGCCCDRTAAKESTTTVHPVVANQCAPDISLTGTDSAQHEVESL